MLIVLNILLLLLIVNQLIRIGHTKLNRLLFGFIVLSFTMWYAIPLLLTIFGIRGILDFLDISIDEFLLLSIKELTLYWLIILFFDFLLRSRKLNIIEFKSSGSILRDFYFRWFAVLYMTIYTLYTLLFQMDYSSNNDINNQQGGIFQLMTLFAYYFIAYFWTEILFERDKNFRKVSVSIIFVLSVVLVLAGSRVYLVSIIFLLYELFSKVKNVKVRRRNYFVILTVILLALFSLPYLSVKRAGKDIDLESINVESPGYLVLEELNTKLNNTAYSVILLKYDGDNFAGLNPYLGSVFKYVPRVIWNGKPTATSFNSDVSGIPSRRVPELLGVDSDIFNTGIAAYSVSSWQLGIFTVILTLLFNVFNLMLINNFLQNKSVYIKTFGFLLVGFPQLNMTPTYGDNILQKLIEASVFMIILFALNLISIKKPELGVMVKDTDE